MRERVRVSQPNQPKTLSPTLQVVNPKPDLLPLLIVRIEAILVVRSVAAQLELGKEILEGNAVAIDAGHELGEVECAEGSLLRVRVRVWVRV